MINLHLMKCKIFHIVMLCILAVVCYLPLKAQFPAQEKDTFFLAKKRGLLGKLGRSIAVQPSVGVPQKTVNPYLPYEGFIINSIEIVRCGFERNINDLDEVKRGFGIKLANAFHKNTITKVILNDLLFTTGDRVYPNVIADNERLLRQEIYLQDARIILKPVSGKPNMVDVIVITKDVFSIGGSLNIANISPQKGELQLKEENLGGTATGLHLYGFYDQLRSPQNGYTTEYVKHNIKGSFIDWTAGITTYAPMFNNGKNEVASIYSDFERPLLTPYMSWTGALTTSYNESFNDYHDSLYAKLYKYRYYNFDGWYGYNFGSKKYLYKNKATRTRKFIAIRGLDQYFSQIPDTNKIVYNYLYANINGALASFNIFKQNFYKANFIYGFGRNEDVPEGFNASLIGGWINKEGRKRPYTGFSGELNHFSKNGFYSDYTVMFGAYEYQNKLEDVSILLNIFHFTKLKELNTFWYNRSFITANITKQFYPVLDQPLMLQSGTYGLSYFGNYHTYGDFRAILKYETYFFNMRKFLGFRFAPFAFGHFGMLNPTNENLSKSDGFTAFGAGVRTRNENFIFGTIELRGYYFPRTVPGMAPWMIQLNSNLQFKFNSTFITKPDFVVPN